MPDGNYLEGRKGKGLFRHPLALNSPGADYAPAIFKDGKIVFTSDRQAATGDKKYNWTGNEFSDLFIADVQSGDVQPFDNQLNTEINEGTATFNRDRTELLFTRCYGDKKRTATAASCIANGMVRPGRLPWRWLFSNRA
jgi:hypothetical protein